MVGIISAESVTWGQNRVGHTRGRRGNVSDADLGGKSHSSSEWSYSPIYCHLKLHFAEVSLPLPQLLYLGVDFPHLRRWMSFWLVRELVFAQAVPMGE